MYQLMPVFWGLHAGGAQLGALGSGAVPPPGAAEERVAMRHDDKNLFANSSFMKSGNRKSEKRLM